MLRLYFEISSMFHIQKVKTYCKIVFLFKNVKLTHWLTTSSGILLWVAPMIDKIAVKIWVNDKSSLLIMAFIKLWRFSMQIMNLLVNEFVQEQQIIVIRFVILFKNFKMIIPQKVVNCLKKKRINYEYFIFRRINT